MFFNMHKNLGWIHLSLLSVLMTKFVMTQNLKNKKIKIHPDAFGCHAGLEADAYSLSLIGTTCIVLLTTQQSFAQTRSRCQNILLDKGVDSLLASPRLFTDVSSSFINRLQSYFRNNMNLNRSAGSWTKRQDGNYNYLSVTDLKIMIDEIAEPRYTLRYGLCEYKGGCTQPVGNESTWLPICNGGTQITKLKEKVDCSCRQGYKLPDIDGADKSQCLLDGWEISVCEPEFQFTTEGTQSLLLSYLPIIIGLGVIGLTIVAVITVIINQLMKRSRRRSRMREVMSTDHYNRMKKELVYDYVVSRSRAPSMQDSLVYSHVTPSQHQAMLYTGLQGNQSRIVQSQPSGPIMMGSKLGMRSYSQVGMPPGSHPMMYSSEHRSAAGQSTYRAPVILHAHPPHRTAKRKSSAVASQGSSGGPVPKSLQPRKIIPEASRSTEDGYIEID